MSPIDRRKGNAPGNRFRLGKSNAKFMGVCSGLADWLGVDVTLVRILWVIATLLGVGSLVLVYLAIGMIAD